MPDINEVYQSGNFMKAADITQPMIVTINSVGINEMTDSKTNQMKRRLKLDFMETDQVLVLNKTNATIIADAFGSDYSKWAGKQIQLRPGKTLFQGRMTPCINVLTPSARPAQRAPTQAPTGDAAAAFDDANEAPF